MRTVPHSRRPVFGGILIYRHRCRTASEIFNQNNIIYVIYGEPGPLHATFYIGTRVCLITRSFPTTQTYIIYIYIYRIYLFNRLPHLFPPIMIIMSYCHGVFAGIYHKRRRLAAAAVELMVVVVVGGRKV